MLTTPNSPLIITAFTLLLQQFAVCQSTPMKARFDAYFGVGVDAYQSTISDGWLDDSAVGLVAAGLEVEVEYSDLFAAGGGLAYKPYAFGFNFTDSNTPDATEVMNSLQIPIFLKARKKIAKRDANFYAMGGGVLCFNLDYDKEYPNESRTGIVNGETIVSDGLVKANIRHVFPLALVGAGVETRIFNEQRNPDAWPLRAGLSCRRYLGFVDVMRADIEYYSNNQLVGTAKGTHYGGYWLFSFHLAYAWER